MIGVLTGFIEELRTVGIPVSMVEATDAARALEVIDLGDREAVRAALGATLVKNAAHFDAFATAFEVYFGNRPARSRRGVAVPEQGLVGDGAGSTMAAGGGGVDELVLALLDALEGGDDAVLRAVARRAVARLGGVEPGRPVAGTYYAYRTLRRLGIDDIAVAVLSRMPPATASSLADRWRREEIEHRIDRFRVMVQDEVRRLLVADRGPEAVARTLRRPLLEDVDLTQATRAELAEVERIIHPLTRRLATRLSRRRSGRKGRLDVRGTIRRSLSTGGVPVDPRFRRRVASRPEIFLLCDISGSVATFARFTMQLIHAMSNQFSRVRSFAFIDAIDEVTRFFEPGADLRRVVTRIGTEAGVVWLDGHSDYGNAFAQFVSRYGDGLSPRSVVIVTGDARTNYHDPNTAALGEIADASRAVYWLNPEASRYWDTGDSVMSAYSPHCHAVHEVRTLRQLAAFVTRVTLPATVR